MVSRIDPPQMPPSPGTPPRRTEETDTKQAILRHEPDHHRKKKNDDDAVESLDIYEDLSDVSITALRGFLQNLLAQIDVARASPTPNITPHPAERPPANPKAAAAMQAYQAGANRGVSTHTPPPPPINTTPQTALDAATLNLDRADLLAVLRDLDRIEARGITAISLEKGDGFLASISAGISRALSRI